MKKRILLVNSTLHMGGAENVSRDLALGLDKDRFDVCVCCLRAIGSIGISLREAGVTVVAPDEPRSEGVSKYLSAKWLMSVITRFEPNILHSHDVHSLIDSAVCAKMRRRVHHVHTFHFGNYPNRPQRHYVLLETLFVRLLDAAVCVGARQREQVARALRINQKKLKLIPNGVSYEYAPDKTLLNGCVAEDTKIIISVSTLTKQKDLFTLLSAVQILKDLRSDFMLWIAGDGPLRQELEDRAEALGVVRQVRFLGWVSNAASRLLPFGTVFVQSSLWEAMSIVVIEAMSQGKAIVATEVGDNGRVLERDVSGILVPTGAPRELALAINRVLSDESLCERLGRNARLEYERKYTLDRMCEDYGRIYDKL